MEFETVDYSGLDTLNLALSNYFAHSLPNGKLYKNTINGLAVFLAPYVSSVGASGYVEVSGNTLPQPTQNSAFAIIGKGTFTQASGGNITTDSNLNVISWDGTSWSLTISVPTSYQERIQNCTDFDDILTIYNDTKARYGKSGYASSGTLNLRFFGDKIQINGILGTDTGNVEIFVDGVSQGVIDTYRFVTVYGLIYEKDFSEEGFHNIDIKILGTKNPNSSDNLFYLCDIHYFGEITEIERLNSKRPNMDTVQECVEFDDVLTIFNDSRAKFGRSGYAAKGDINIRSFSNRFVLNGILGSDTGNLEIFIDGVSQGVIDTYRFIARYETIFSKDFDSDKLRNITLRILGTKNDASSDVLIYISDVNHYSTNIHPDNLTERVQNCTDFNGVLTIYNDPRTKYGKTGYSGSGEIKLSFFGNRIILNGILGADTGNIEIFVNGVSQGVIDTYRFITRYGVIYEKQFNKSGFQEVVVKILGTKNADSRDVLLYLSDIQYFSYKTDFSKGGNFGGDPTENSFFGINVLDYGVKNDGTTDNTDALNALLNVLINDVSGVAGRTVYFPTGVYRFDGNLIIYKQFQAPIIFAGEGAWSTGKGGTYSGGGTVFKFYSTSNNPKLYLKGNGNFQTSGITYLNADGASNSPLIKVMNTRLHAMNNAFIGNKSALLCDQDAIVLGGDVEIETPSIDDNGGFQGYGTVIRDNHFNKIRRAVYGKTFANAVVVSSNSVWIESGSNLAGGAAFEFDGGLDPNGAQHVAGGLIENNLVEIHNYTYGYKLGKTYAFNLSNNTAYDPGSQTSAVYYLGAKAERTLIIPGFMPVPNSQYGNIRIVKDDSVIKTNRIVFGTLITGDINQYP